MSDIITYDKKIISSITINIMDKINYVNARAEADALAKEDGGMIVDAPRLIMELANAQVRTAIRKNCTDLNSAEYYGKTQRGRIYAVGHSLGPLATTSRITRGAKQQYLHGVIQLNDNEWKTFMKQPQTVHLDDIKKGFSSNNPYGIFINLDKDDAIIHNPGNLSYDRFMKDDIALMFAGSEDARVNIAKILFKKEQRDSLGVYHTINNTSLGNVARPICLDDHNRGFSGRSHIEGITGRFIVVTPKTYPNKEYSDVNEFLEARVKQALKSKQPFEYNSLLWTPVPGAKLK